MKYIAALMLCILCIITWTINTTEAKASTTTTIIKAHEGWKGEIPNHAVIFWDLKEAPAQAGVVKIFAKGGGVVLPPDGGGYNIVPRYAEPGWTRLVNTGGVDVYLYYH